MPVVSEEWWFASTYIILFLLYPFLNVLLTNLTKKQFQAMLLTMGVCWCIIPSSFVLNFYITQNELSCSTLLWFSFIYSMGGYIQLHFKMNSKWKSKYFLVTAVLAMCLTFVSTVVFDMIGIKNKEVASYATFYYGMKKIPMVLIPVCLFLWGIIKHIRNSKVINIISSTTFGIYLIHDHPLVRTWLWNDVFHNSTYANSAYLIPYALFSILLVFIFCGGIDWIRKSTVERVWEVVLNSLVVLLE